MDAPYQAFSAAEFSERFVRARNAVRAAGCEGCVMVAPEHHYYFCGYDAWVSVNSPQAIVFTAEDDAPALILRDVDISLALESTWIDDIRTYSLVLESYAERLRGILAEKGITSGRVAMELQSYALPASLCDGLREALPEVEFVDVTNILGGLRLVKSPAEMAYMERAAAFANEGLKAMASAVREGTSEIAVAAAIEAAMRAKGSDYPAIPTELSSGSRSAGGHATPRERPIERGDLVHAEFAGVAARYHATAIRTLACGEPDPRARELYDIGIASLKAGIDAVAPGVAVGRVEEASLEPLRAHGLEAAAMMRFGYGIGIAYPPIWLETLQIARGFDLTIEPGMAFVLHSCIELPHEGLGVIQGGTWVLEESGLRLIAGAGDCALTIL